jgi:hypothetical protein
LVLGATAAFLLPRARARTSPAAGGPAPLSADEQKRLEALLSDKH